MASDRCPRCGAQLALVGRLHLCRKDARERPKPRLVEPANKPANKSANRAANTANRAANRPANKAGYKAKMDRRLYQRELMRARRAAARAQQGEPGDKAGLDRSVGGSSLRLAPPGRL